MKVTFRQVSHEDLKRLNDIVNDSDVSRYLQLVPPVSMKLTRDLFERCRKEKTRWYCIKVDGKIAGSTMVRKNNVKSKRGHTADFGINIAKEFWGKGVGDKTMEFVIKKSKKAGVKRLELEVVAENTRARRLYEKHGFMVEGVKKKSFRIGGRYHDTIMMAKLLD